jgi:epoxyqueuosine reductase
LEAPYRVDARKCISYLTIESPGPIPQKLRKACGDRLFGCDACQEACPWNRSTPIGSEDSFQPRPGLNPVSLAELFTLDEGGFRQRFGDTPLWRAKLAGLLRNAAGVLGNQPDKNARAALERGLQHADPIVKETCAWAIKEIGE